jgi:hypothetical protein
MRAVALLLCLGLAACAGGKIPGEQPEPLAFAASTQAAPSQAAAAPPPIVRTAAPGGARGGASTASARAPAPSTASEDNPDAPTPTGDPLTQARADCWMKTEKLKMRDIDARAAFVDKCVTEVMKTGHKP